MKSMSLVLATEAHLTNNNNNNNGAVGILKEEKKNKP